jgi:hypothetical protein
MNNRNITVVAESDGPSAVRSADVPVKVGFAASPAIDAGRNESRLWVDSGRFRDFDKAGPGNATAARSRSPPCRQKQKGAPSAARACSRPIARGAAHRRRHPTRGAGSATEQPQAVRRTTVAADASKADLCPAPRLSEASSNGRGRNRFGPTSLLDPRRPRARRERRWVRPPPLRAIVRVHVIWLNPASGMPTPQGIPSATWNVRRSIVTRVRRSLSQTRSGARCSIETAEYLAALRDRAIPSVGLHVGLRRARSRRSTSADFGMYRRGRH